MVMFMKNKDIKKILGENVRFYRYANKFTQEKLAEKCDLSPRYVSDIENGNGNISIETLAKLSETLKVSAPKLIEKQNIKPLPQRVNMK